MKGKPWTVEEETQLRELVKERHFLPAIAERMKKPEEAIRQKIRRLGLEVVEQSRSVCSTTSMISLPKELLSIFQFLYLGFFLASLLHYDQRKRQVCKEIILWE